MRDCGSTNFLFCARVRACVFNVLFWGVGLSFATVLLVGVLALSLLFFFISRF